MSKRHHFFGAVPLLTIGGVTGLLTGCEGSDEDGDTHVACGCVFGLPAADANLNETDSNRAPDWVPVVGGQLPPNAEGYYVGAGAAYTVAVCVDTGGAFEPEQLKDRIDSKCQSVCGSRVSWNFGNHILGECVDGEPYNSGGSGPRGGAGFRAGGLPNTSSYRIQGASSLALSRDDHDNPGVSVASGTFDLKNQDCVAPCAVELRDMKITGADTSVDGHDVKALRAILSEVAFGTKLTDGTVVFAPGALTFDVSAEVMNDVRPQLVTSSAPAILAATPNGGWEFFGSGSSDDGRIEFTISGVPEARPPVAVVTPSVQLECDPLQGGGPLSLNGGQSYDPDGDPMALLWRSKTLPGLDDQAVYETLAPVGEHEVKLYATDSGKWSTAVASITVTDNLPPVMSPPASTTIESCSSESVLVALPQPGVVDLCSQPTLSGEVIEINGAPTNRSVIDGMADVPPGRIKVRWTATKGSGASQSMVVDYTVLARPVLRGADRVVFHDRSEVEAVGGVRPLVVVTGSGGVEIGSQARTGSIHSIGTVFARSNSHAYGGVITAGTVVKQQGAVIDGPVLEGAIVQASNAPVRHVSLTGGGAPVSLEPNTTRTIVPGSYGEVTVKSGATLYLQAGDYAFTKVMIEPSASVVLLGDCQMAVYGDVYIKGTLSGGFPVFEVFGSRNVFLERSFTGAVLGPDSAIVLGTGNAMVFRGEFFGRIVEVRPDADVIHESYTCGG